MTLKKFIQANAAILIVSFFCIGIFIGLSGSVALILLSFFVGVFVGLKTKRGNFKNQLIEQAQAIIIGEAPLIRLSKKRKRIR